MMTYLAQHRQPGLLNKGGGEGQQRRREVGDYYLGKTIGRGATGKNGDVNDEPLFRSLTRQNYRTGKAWNSSSDGRKSRDQSRCT